MEKINWMDFKTNTNPILDSYRSLRTNLQKLTKGDSGCVLEMTSAVPNATQGEVVAGLAIVLAQGGSKTLVIDSQQNAPAQHILFDIPNKGITDAITTGTGIETYVQPCVEQENLFVLPVGSVAQNAGELMCSESVRQFISDSRTAYDYVLVDMPSVSDSSDTVAFATQTDGVLLVVTSREDHLNELLGAKNKLIQAGATILGCILNKVKVTA